MHRYAIVLAAFGTYVPEARKVFDHIDKAVKARYPQHDVRWAFTSQAIIDKLKKQGIVKQNFSEVMRDLKASGCRAAIFQSLHVVPGQEYNAIRDVDTCGIKAVYGDALLTTEEDIRSVINAIGNDIKAGMPNVIVAHGNDNYPEYNVKIIEFAEKIESIYENVFVVTVEGRPGTKKLRKAGEQAKISNAVNFIPLMIVSGDHIMNDVMGDNADSFKNIIGVSSTACARSLGWNDGVLNIYFRHIDVAMAKLKENMK